MKFEKLDPYIRFVKIFSYFPKEEDFVMGYDYRLFYITDGSIFLNFKDSSYKLDKYSLAFIPPQYPYKLSSYNGTSCEILCFNFDSIKGMRSDETIHPVSENEYDMGLVFEKEKIDELQKHIIIPDASSLDDRLREIHREFQTTHFGYRKKAESLFTSMLVSVIRYSKETPKKEVILARDVREYLAEHISEDCSADILSEIFHYHPNYINRVFKENHGTTIHNFLIRQRIKIAKELLVTSNLTLEKISVRCGFKTLAHFSQCFKNNCGMSPSQFRKMSDTVII